jgi:1-acyl-sn-glycerol-3-phosphate acyltransferase
LLPQFKETSVMGLASLLKKGLVSERISRHVDSVPKNLGAGGYDAWGFNKEVFKASLPIAAFLHDQYFRVESHGLANVPADGRVLLIANHAGQLPLDGVMIGAALALREENPRFARAMIERFFPTVPFLGNALNGMGAVVGDPLNCEKMLDREEAVVVFPEGVGGSGKPWSERYQLQRFGSGFMHLAMNKNTPIIPVGVVGSEETMPSLGNFSPLARLLGVPYIPIAAPFPLPAKIVLNFGEPLVFANDLSNEDDMTANVEIVKDAIRALIKKGLSQRESVF